MKPANLLVPPPKEALAVFNKGYSCIVKDDGCYVVMNFINPKWKWSTHIFPEAFNELKKLPALEE